MQAYEGELNHLAKLEEFLRVKGSRRICEADEKEEMKKQEEIQRCEQEIARYDALLDEIFVSDFFEKFAWRGHARRRLDHDHCWHTIILVLPLLLVNDQILDHLWSPF